MDLASWQERLENHFEELYRRRNREAPGQPTFALEHGLTDNEIVSIAEGIRDEIRESQPLWAHRLPWLVYASEFGYLYAGDEYWQSFEDKTPGWIYNGDRHWVRRCFVDFHKNFGGAKPTGAWASRFSIICWPITHAILPCDLQRQLAHLLYDLRYSLSSDTLESPQKLGEAIAAGAWKTSSRFRKLVQEPLFIGQIAAALLTKDSLAASSLIHTPTLSRISSDLDRERVSRAWMRGARESVTGHVSFRTIRGQSISMSARGDQDRDGAPTTISLEPRLLLRRTVDMAWQVALELPDFSPLLTDSRKLQELLTTSRCVVTGSSGRPRGREWLLHGTQVLVLKTWPPSNTALLQFEDAPTDFEFLLDADCVIRPGPRWIFKVASDGIAYELKTGRVRPENIYIVVTEDGSEMVANSAVASVSLSCEGVQAFELRIPEAIGSELSDALNSLGIEQAGSLQLWPAGLPPVRWDGGGRVEWLTTDTPCIGLCVDHPVRIVTLELEGITLSVESPTPGTPMFVQLPRMAPGKYTLEVSLVRDLDGRTEEESDILEINIRAPRPWSPGSSTSGAFFVIAEPATATLEQLWEGEVAFEVYGSPAQAVQSNISLFDKGGQVELLTRRLPPLRPPIDRAMWQRHFDQNFKKPREVQNAYDTASSCRVEMEAGEHGRFTYEVEREFAPLRWAVRRSSDGLSIRLLDDRGVSGVAEICHYQFESPDIAKPVTSNNLDDLGGKSSSPGLYTATAPEYSCGVVVVPEIHTSFAELRVQPRLEVRRRTESDIHRLARVAELWATARQVGSHLALPRRIVLARLVDELFALLAGDRWARIEAAIACGDSRSILEFLLRDHKKADEIEFARKLNALAPDLAESVPRDRVRVFAGLAADHFDLRDVDDVGPANETSTSVEWLSEFAIRLASCSKRTIGWAGSDAHVAVVKLMETPSLARGARMLVLTLANELNVSEETTGLYEGWIWQ